MVTSTVKVTSDKFFEKTTVSLFGFKKLIAWEKADKLAHEVYELTMKFPKEEAFGVTSQIRKAVLSVPLNIVEGHARNNKNEFRRFLTISLGSLAEVEYVLEFSYLRGFVDEQAFARVSKLRQEVGHIFWKLFLSQK